MVEVMVIARLLARRYTTPSQATGRAAEVLDFLKRNVVEAVQDVEIRWWSTHSFLERFLHLRQASAVHESISHDDEVKEKLTPIIPGQDWAMDESI